LVERPLSSYGQAIAGHAEREPDRVAIRCEGESRTRAELDRRANRLARAYASLGVKAGDLVTIALPNGCEFYEACLATWRLGATPNPVSARLPELERRAIVETAQPALVVGAPAGERYERPAVTAGFEPAAALSDAPLPDVVSRCVRAMTSGGSTGRPKVVVDTVPAECDPEKPENGITAGGVTLVPGPLYHAGPFMTSWSTLLTGGTAVVMRQFDAERALALIEEHRVDWVLFVPTMMQRIWRLPEAVRTRYDLSSLRRVMCTGAPSPPWLKRAWIEWLGPERIYEAYGGTERIAGTIISGSEWLAHPGSVGKPTLGRKIRILDAAGEDCAPREVGEVFMLPAGGRGSTYRYLGAEATATADGWESLGDMGYLDEDGYLYLVERKTDMIVTGGANVYPAEVEGAIDAHPAVRSSAVVGLPDEDLGLRVHAIVDAPGGVSEEALRAHLAERLVRYKIPRTFEFVTAPLRDDAGKLRRSALRDARLGRRP
jgi:bile acid-coenzyme A ligase